MKPYTGLLPRSVDLRPSVNATTPREYPGVAVPLLAKLGNLVGWRVEDQGQLGACTAFGSTTALEIIYERMGQNIQLSPMYQYYWTRADGNGLGQEGANPELMIQQLQKRGVCLDATWPYNPANENTQPPAVCDIEARLYRVTGFESPAARPWVDWAKNCIANGSPVMFSMGVTQDFINQGWAQHDWRTFTYSGYPPNVGYHEMCAIGYDDSVNKFLVQNSWGPGWGDGGFLGLPYQTIENVTNTMHAITSCQVSLVPVDQPPTPVPYIVDGKDTIHRMLQAIYQESFRREPDSDGEAYWTKRCYTEFRRLLRSNALGDDAKNMTPELRP